MGARQGSRPVWPSFCLCPGDVGGAMHRTPCGCSLRGTVGMVWGVRFVGFTLPGSPVVGCAAQPHLSFPSSVTLFTAIRKSTGGVSTDAWLSVSGPH